MLRALLGAEPQGQAWDIAGMAFGGQNGLWGARRGKVGTSMLNLQRPYRCWHGRLPTSPAAASLCTPMDLAERAALAQLVWNYMK